VQLALDEILRNFPQKSVGLLVRIIIFPLGLSLRQPNDSLGKRVAAILLKPGEARDRLTSGIFVSEDASDITGKLEDALRKVLLADPIEKRLRAGQYVKADLQSFDDWLTELVSADVINEAEAELLRQSKHATREVIKVDEFKAGELESAEVSIDRVA
jgi:acyl-CoA dehydrogenase